MRAIFFQIILLCIALMGCHSVFGPPDSLAVKAEEMESKGELDKAIETFKAHIDSRLAESQRPDWENPYFYQLMIGDIYLKKGEPEKAIENYVSAESMGVESELVSDRLIQIAKWYEDKGDINGAIDLLLKFRKRDSLRYDGRLNDLSRKLTEIEDHPSVGGANKIK